MRKPFVINEIGFTSLKFAVFVNTFARQFAVFVKLLIRHGTILHILHGNVRKTFVINEIGFASLEFAVFINAFANQISVFIEFLIRHGTILHILHGNVRKTFVINEIGFASFEFAVFIDAFANQISVFIEFLVSRDAPVVIIRHQVIIAFRIRHLSVFFPAFGFGLFGFFRNFRLLFFLDGGFFRFAERRDPRIHFRFGLALKESFFGFVSVQVFFRRRAVARPVVFGRHPDLIRKAKVFRLIAHFHFIITVRADMARSVVIIEALRSNIDFAVAYLIGNGFVFFAVFFVGLRRKRFQIAMQVIIRKSHLPTFVVKPDNPLRHVIPVKVLCRFKAVFVVRTFLAAFKLSVLKGIVR